MGYGSSRSWTETSPSISRRSKPIRAAWWSFFTRYEDIAASHGTPPPNNSHQPTPTIGARLSSNVRRRVEFDLDFSKSPDWLENNEDQRDCLRLLRCQRYEPRPCFLRRHSGIKTK